MSPFTHPAILAFVADVAQLQYLCGPILYSPPKPVVTRKTRSALLLSSRVTPPPSMSPPAGPGVTGERRETKSSAARARDESQDQATWGMLVWQRLMTCVGAAAASNW